MGRIPPRKSKRERSYRRKNIRIPPRKHMELTEEEMIEKYVDQVKNKIYLFILRNIEALNVADYVEKIITYIRQEKPFVIRSDYIRLKRIIRELVENNISCGHLNRDRFTNLKNNQKPNRAIRRKNSSNIAIVDNTKTAKNETSHDQPAKDDSSDFIIPDLAFSQLSLSQEILEKISRIMFYLRNPDIFSTSILKPSVGALIQGLPGSGKTSLIRAICGEYKFPLLRIPAVNLLGDLKNTSETKLSHYFKKLEKVERGILFIDDIDCILSNSSDSASFSKFEERNFANSLSNCLDHLSTLSQCRVFVFAATSNFTAIDGFLRRAGRFEYEISIPMPDEYMRENILKTMTKNIIFDHDLSIKDVSLLTPGFVAKDLASLLREMTYSSLSRQNIFHIGFNPSSKITVSRQDFLKNTISSFQPSSIREGFETNREVSLSDVGGLDKIKDYLNVSIAGSINNSDVFKKLGLKPSTGVLLVGPPGCGKTLIAKAIANHEGLNYISVRGPELMNSYVGETERAIRNLFSRAQIAEPCLIFFDEIDSICPIRSSDSNNNYSARLVNQLLTEIDNALSKKRIFIIGATNRPDIIDKALLRKGRFDRIFYIGLPNSTEKHSILRSLTKFGTCPPLAPDVDLKSISEDFRTSNFSGADLASLIREASLLAYKDFIKVDNISLNSIIIKSHHIEEALISAKPSATSLDLEYYNKLELKYS